MSKHSKASNRDKRGGKRRRITSRQCAYGLFAVKDRAKEQHLSATFTRSHAPSVQQISQRQTHPSKAHIRTQAVTPPPYISKISAVPVAFLFHLHLMATRSSDARPGFAHPWSTSTRQNTERARPA